MNIDWNALFKAAKPTNPGAVPQPTSISPSTSKWNVKEWGMEEWGSVASVIAIGLWVFDRVSNTRIKR